jgi:hypothetical protein
MTDERPPDTASTEAETYRPGPDRATGAAGVAEAGVEAGSSASVGAGSGTYRQEHIDAIEARAREIAGAIHQRGAIPARCWRRAIAEALGERAVDPAWAEQMIARWQPSDSLPAPSGQAQTHAETIREMLRKGERDDQLLDGRDFSFTPWRKAYQALDALLADLARLERERDQWHADFDRISETLRATIADSVARAGRAREALDRIRRNAENNGDEFTRMLAVAALAVLEGGQDG